MTTEVKEWMSGDPVSVEPEASALEALELMVDRGIRHLPVVDPRHRVVGVLSIDDLRAALPFAVGLTAPPSAAQREEGRGWRVGEIMTHEPVTLREGADLADATERMLERRIGCLPVVDAEGRLAGLLSETDLLRALATMLWADRVREERAREGEVSVLVDSLRREREALARRLDAYHAEERAVAVHPAEEPLDLAERGAEMTGLGVTQALDAMAARRLEALDRALDHAAQGRLGVCDRCGGAIPVERLRALPGTTLCVACARAEER